jgi:hypothetical protein
MRQDARKIRANSPDTPEHTGATGSRRKNR